MGRTAMKPPTPSPPATRRVAITVRGVVQGVGFRPFVYNTARGLGLAGWVRNEAGTVRIEVEGSPPEVDVFLTVLRDDPPPQARIEELAVEEMAPAAMAGAPFEIRSSDGARPPSPTIPADLATCRECLAEVSTAGGRRFRYPFTNCTNCGPRWSIIRRLPYDRPRTSMAGFAMCADCRGEYEDPTDRRFHAQPIACPACGPSLRLVDRGGAALAEADAALRQAARAVRQGRVLALKGLGGFQLVVDATSAAAVDLLRQRKRRPDKPLAIMLATVEEIGRRCRLGDQEARVLGSPAAPILLLRRRVDQAAVGDVAEPVAPANPYLGVMLPYTPLHHLLMEAVRRPIVCTSGNLSEEPMATSSEEALGRLGQIADVFLVHDRPIVRPVDDSVARWGPRGLQVLRRARGYAPLPIRLARKGPCVLATGGHLKNTVALSVGDQAILSQHVGDLDNLLSVEVHRRAIADLVGFFQARPEAVACDLHPDYASTRVAAELAGRWNVPLVRVQHHHAHVAAGMAEHGLAGPVLGLAWDGTGYGTDGTVWGGEVLRCEGDRFVRVGHLRRFSLPGGDRAVRQPRRSALGVLYEILGRGAVEYAKDWFCRTEIQPLVRMLERRVGSPRTSSLGRLFDAVACLCGLAPVIHFEGQAAMGLEFAADGGEQAAYPLPLADGAEAAVADWEPMIRAVLDDRKSGLPVGQISGRFHNALAEWALQVARRQNCRRMVLTGGCFQNALLTERVFTRLSRSGFEVYTQGKVPPGDGSIALGQLMIATSRIRENTPP